MLNVHVHAECSYSCKHSYTNRIRTNSFLLTYTNANMHPYKYTCIHTGFISIGIFCSKSPAASLRTCRYSIFAEILNVVDIHDLEIFFMCTSIQFWKVLHQISRQGHCIRSTYTYTESEEIVFWRHREKTKKYRDMSDVHNFQNTSFKKRANLGFHVHTHLYIYEVCVQILEHTQLYTRPTCALSLSLSPKPQKYTHTLTRTRTHTYTYTHILTPTATPTHAHSHAHR